MNFKFISGLIVFGIIVYIYKSNKTEKYFTDESTQTEFFDCNDLNVLPIIPEEVEFIVEALDAIAEVYPEITQDDIEEFFGFVLKKQA